MIVTANKYFNERFETWKLKYLIPMMLRHGIMSQPRLDDRPVRAYVNHGKWVAGCECGGAEVIWEERLFMCQSCWNSASKHNFRPVVFPDDRVKIERLLEKRPLVNRNYLLTDTVEILKAENEAHKMELLEVK